MLYDVIGIELHL